MYLEIILNYLPGILLLCSIIWIAFSIFFSDNELILKKISLKKEKEKIRNIYLQDYSLKIQIFVSMALAFILYSISRTGILAFNLFLIGIVFLDLTFVYLWKYHHIKYILIKQSKNMP